MKRTTLNSHVVRLMYAAATQDQAHDWGCRYASAGDVGVFEGFEFGNQLSLNDALPKSFARDLNVAAGSMKVEFPSFIVRKRKGFPAAATHFRIVSAGAAINFTEHRFVNDVKTSALLPLRKQTPAAICLEHSIKAGPDDVMVQALGIQFFTIENGKEVLVKGGAVRILAAERVTQDVLAPVDVPQVMEDRPPFTGKRLRAFGDWRRKGLVESSEVELTDPEDAIPIDDFMTNELPILADETAVIDDRQIRRSVRRLKRRRLPFSANSCCPSLSS